MSLFAWLFGKKGAAATAARTEEPPPAESRSSAGEMENVRRWRESGQARAWVDAHDGCWDHAAWLALLEELRRSPFWPMPPDAVGLALEEARREWLQRN